MSIVLGIDTGGTFTDGVIIDLDTKEIMAASKSPTTHQNLIIGIRKTIEQLAYEDIASVDYISLSTTLATNAIVENRGCRVGLLLLGLPIEDELPQCEPRVLPGQYNIRGEETEPLDLAATEAAIESLNHKVDAVAVSGLFSVRNPNHEKKVKSMVRKSLGLPVVAAHELTSVLGMKERTITAVLNARLIYVIDELLTAVRKILDERGLTIPIMVVKGDGSLMSESAARERPIETVLSGPAASIIGADFLSETKNGIVLDMGGTTTDIAVLKNGLPRLDKNGAKVGGWRTKVEAVEATTFGLGGDSHINYNMEKRRFQAGPRRCWPLAVICRDYPCYLEELQQISASPVGLKEREHAEGVFLLREPSPYMNISDRESQVLEIVKDNPHTLVEIAHRIGMDVNFLNLDALIDLGILGTVGFTPTDLLHLLDKCHIGSMEGARFGAELMANHRGLSLEGFLQKIREIVTEKLCRVILDSVFTYDKVPVDLLSEDNISEFFFQNAVWQQGKNMFTNTFTLQPPLIGIGAPTQTWLPLAAEKLNAKVVFPQYHYVANAVGAAAGKVMTIQRILVENYEAQGVFIHGPWGNIKFKPQGEQPINQERLRVMDQAIEFAKAEGEKYLRENMSRQGITDYDIIVEQKDSSVGSKEQDNLQIHIATAIDIIAIGRPKRLEEKAVEKSLLGKFWGKDKNPDYTKAPY